MKKKEGLLKVYNVDSLSAIADDEILMLAQLGELGLITQSASCKVWAFKSEHELAEHIRKALELGKELSVSFGWGEFYGPDKITVEFKTDY